MAHLSNKSVNNSNLKKSHTPNTNATMGPDESNEVLDLRKSNSGTEKLCFWCGKRGSLSATGVESDFCSEVCFDQFRRDSFKKRSSCMWCNNANQGVFNINLMSNLDETKFCSEHCLTQFKVRLFCEETSAHLDKLKDGSLSVMNGLPSTATTTSSTKSPISIPAETTMGLADLITPDLWLKKSPNFKSSTSTTCITTSPFHNSFSPRGSSTSPPMMPISPPTDHESLSLSESNLGTMKSNGSGSLFLNRLQSLTAMPLTNCSSKLSSMMSTSGGSIVGETKHGTSLRNDILSGGNLKKRSKLNAQHSPNELSSRSCNSLIQPSSKGSNNKIVHSRGIKGRKMRLLSQKARTARETSWSDCGDVKKQSSLSISNYLPFQQSSMKSSQVGPPPQNIFLSNGHTNKINFGNLGFALSGGVGLGGFPSSFLQRDDNENSTEGSSSSSSSSCSTMSQSCQAIRSSTSEREQLFQATNPSHQSRGSQTDIIDTQAYESGPGTQNLSSSMSILPPVTVLVPFPVAVPIPIPIPIPVILGPGFTRTEKSFGNFKGTGDEIPNNIIPETSTSQECNSSSNKGEVPKENDTDDSHINSNSTPTTSDNREGKAQAVCELVKVEDSRSAAR